MHGSRWQAGMTARDAGEQSQKCAADTVKKSSASDESHGPYPKPTQVDK